MYFFESKDDIFNWLRYLFIGLNLFFMIKEKQSCFIVIDYDGRFYYIGNEFKEVLNWMNIMYKIKMLELGIFFVGGVVGYLSYDMILLIEFFVFLYLKEIGMEKCMLFVCWILIVYDYEIKNVYFI